MKIITSHIPEALDDPRGYSDSPYVVLQGSPLDIEPYDEVAGITVAGVSRAEHNGRPAVRLTLGSGTGSSDATPGNNVGRLIIEVNTYEEAGIIEWVRTFDTIKDMNEFVASNAFRVPTGFRSVLARQLGINDVIAVGEDSVIQTLGELQEAYPNVETRGYDDISLVALDNTVSVQLTRNGFDTHLMPDAQVFVVS